ncbi:MAG: PIN domain-containing protein [Gemmatimonadota bacterium]
MTAPTFVDTNVLVYARDSGLPEKQRQASEWLQVLWQQRRGRLSTQVLNEYYVTVTQKLTPGLSRASARQDVRNLLAWDPVALDAGMIEAAYAVQDRFGFSWWDCLIVSAARAAGCEILLTEDLQDGQDLDGIVVVNPFTTLPVDG